MPAKRTSAFAPAASSIRIIGSDRFLFEFTVWNIGV
jgi:hypothetical protein